MKKTTYNFTYPVNFPIHFVNMLKENGSNISSAEVKMVIQAVQYDIARKFDTSEEGIQALASIMKAVKNEFEEIENNPKPKFKII